MITISMTKNELNMILEAFDSRDHDCSYDLDSPSVVLWNRLKVIYEEASK